jgi:Tol biopolymer transport system component
MTFASNLTVCGTSWLLLVSATDVNQQQVTAGASSIAFASHRDGNWEIYVADGNGRNQTMLTRRNGHTRFPLWSPDRSQIAFATQRSEPGDGWEFWIMSADGTNSRRLCSGLVGKSHREWSRDGRRIALTAEIDGNVDVYVVEVASGRLTRLTASAAEDRDPSWSPDGAHIVFSSERDGNREIYLMRPDGTDARRLTNNASKDASPVWSPDGSRIAFVSEHEGRTELYVMHADGSSPERLTNGAHSSSDPPRWSPDGSHIAFQIADQGRYDIGVVSVRDRQQRVVVATPHNDGSYTWSPDGIELAYISGPGGHETLQVVNIRTGESRQLTTTWSLTPDWSR